MQERGREGERERRERDERERREERERETRERERGERERDERERERGEREEKTIVPWHFKRNSRANFDKCKAHYQVNPLSNDNFQIR